MTPEQLAMQLTTPVLRGLDGRARLHLNVSDPDLYWKLSDGERTLLHIASNLSAVEGLAPLVDDTLRRHIAGCCGFVSGHVLAGVTS